MCVSQCVFNSVCVLFTMHVCLGQSVLVSVHNSICVLISVRDGPVLVNVLASVCLWSICVGQWLFVSMCVFNVWTQQCVCLVHCACVSSSECIGQYACQHMNVGQCM